MAPCATLRTFKLFLVDSNKTLQSPYYERASCWQCAVLKERKWRPHGCEQHRADDIDEDILLAAGGAEVDAVAVGFDGQRCST